LKKPLSFDRGSSRLQVLMLKCPGLESNQHVPEDTSPSSYSQSVANIIDSKDLSPPPTPSGAPGGDEIPERDTNHPPAVLQDLAAIVEAWPKLPDSIKQAILALVKASEHVG